MKNKKAISAFMLAMINVALIVSLRGLPLLAEYGLSSIFYLAVASIGLLIPTALVTAELATGWPESGGIFSWVSKAFGTRAGFLAIFLQWIQNVIWYPTVLSFASATIAYMINPKLAENKIFTIAMILIIYWVATYINCKGMRASGILSTLSAICGTLLPGAILIVLGGIWIFSGNASAISFSAKDLMPNLTHFDNVVFLAGLMLLFAGMEVSSVHVNEVDNPQKNYPKAILLSVLIIISVFFLGTLAIAIVIPQQDISLVAGLLQAFSKMLSHYHMSFLVPVIAFFIAFGTLGQVSSWIVGPSRGLFATSEQGYLPPLMKHTNKNNMPTYLMFIQGSIVTLISFVFLLMPTISASYWVLTALTAQLYLIMYLLIYLSALRLRYKEKDTKRPFRIPLKNTGIWIVCSVGIICALFAIILGFFPPAQFRSKGALFHFLFSLIGIGIFLIIPMIIYSCRKPSWKTKAD